MIVDIETMLAGVAKMNMIVLITDIGAIGSETTGILRTDREDVLMRETNVEDTDTDIIDRGVGVLSSIRL